MALSASASSSHLEDFVDDLVGTPYQWGGNSKEGFDCSGFIHYVLENFGSKKELSRSSKDMAQEGDRIAKDDLRIGDLVFFNTSGKGISHVGIYIGDGEFAHSASNKGVTVNKMSEEYYAERYEGARRITYGQVYLTMASTENLEK